VPFTELWERVGGAAPAAVDNDALADTLLQTFLGGFLDLHVQPPPLVAVVSAKPVASPLARHQAQMGERVTTLRHRMVELNGLERRVLVLLDGSRDRAAVLDSLVEAVGRGEVEMTRDGRPLTDLEQVRALLSGRVGPTMDRLARLGLLCS
jgi:hypothetical protein